MRFPKSRKLSLPRRGTAIILTGVLIIGGLTAYVVYSSLTWKMKNDTQEVTSHELGEVIRLEDDQKETTHTTQPYESSFEFNAIAPRWRQKPTTDGTATISIRTSSDAQNWSDWMEIEATQSLRDDVPTADEWFAETPIFLTGKYFQVKTDLSRDEISQTSPEVFDMEVNYLDSREPQIRKVMESAGSFFFKRTSAHQNLNIVSRRDWGNPDPHGSNFKGTDKYWYPSYAPVRQFILHHTVSPNFQSDPQSVLRGIWEYHANSLGWGDIGYNYIVDHNGTVYEGRAGGDNVVAGHTRNFNRDSMGIAVLGCFESSSSACRQLNGGGVSGPTNATINSISTLLSLKSQAYEINPTGQHSFCQGDGTNCKGVWTIAAHRDFMETNCNGNLFYDRLNQIRLDTGSKNTQGWAYNAKQVSYGSVAVGYINERQVTLAFKNTGATTWSNSSHPMTLRVANPRDRASAFRGTGWPAESIVATLNEGSVAPGQTGSFTFNVRYPSFLHDDQIEFFRLVASGAADVPGYFGLWFDHVDEVSWDFNALDGDSGAVSGAAADTGFSPAAITFANKDHVFYYDRGNGDLRHAIRNGSNWQFTTIDGNATGSGRINAHVGATPSVTIHNNQLHLLYYDATNGDLRYGTSDAAGTAWTFQTLDGNGGSNGRYTNNVGMVPEIVSHNGDLHAFYYDAAWGNLRHAWTDAGTWFFENLDGDWGARGKHDADAGHDPVAVSFGDSLQVFYADRTYGNLRHAWLSTAGWRFENLDGDWGSIARLDGNIGSNPAALNYNGQLQLLYYDAGRGNLRHAWSTPAGWRFENLDGDIGSVARHEGNAGMMPTLATSTDGRLHIAYYEALWPIGTLRYGIADAKGWHFQTLDGSGGLPYSRMRGDVGLDPAILPNNSGGVNHFYYDRTNSNIRFAWPQ